MSIIDTAASTSGASVAAGGRLMATVDFRLDDDVVIVTGAASGIGRAIAEAAAAAGAAVGLLDLTESGTEPVAQAITAAGGQALPVAADVTDLDQLRAAVQAVEGHFGPLTLAVNSAGIANAARRKRCRLSSGSMSTMST